MATYRLIATAAFGIEGIVGKEVKALGFENVSVENGRVLFDADEYGLIKANLWLRTADRVFLMLKEFKATSFEELFEGVKSIAWENYIPEDGEFPVNAKSINSKLFSLSDCQAISKKAVVNRLREHYGIEWFEETGPKFPILVGILKDIVTVSIDTSGVGLHKRGYRENANAAPLKETLAAALLKAANWHPKIALMDPMCGTGTIGIEAAMMGRNIAPGLGRKFVSEDWPFIKKEMWKEERVKAYSAIDYDTELRIECYDIDEKAIEIARENAEKAGVDEDVVFGVRDAKDTRNDHLYGYIISNPPYGERLGEKEEVEAMYMMMGEAYSKLNTWSKFILTSHEEFEKNYGKKANKNRKLYNGKIKCYLYQYMGQKPPKTAR